jgi:hypothetical protein
MEKIIFLMGILTITVIFGCISCPLAQESGNPPVLVQQPSPVPPGQPEAMPPPPHGPAVPGPRNVSAETLLKNLPRAAATAQQMSGRLVAGKVWTMQNPAGETEVKGALLYQDSVVAVLRFNPLDNTVLPAGLNAHVRLERVDLQAIKARFAAVMKELKILDAAEFREPEGAWVFPIATGFSIVAHLRVSQDGVHIVPDYPASQELRVYGR